MAEQSMSLEETNKVRISLGLAPLADASAGEVAHAGDGSDVEEDTDAIAEANYAQRRKEEAAARADKEAKERIAKAKNQRELRAKLVGRGLGEEEEEDTDDQAGKKTKGQGGGGASDWVKQSRKRAKERATELEKLKQREKELEERDREATYGEEDLAGLRVAHGTDDFDEGKDVVLTLADRKVLDDDDDELQNVNLAEYARTAERLDLKKRGKTAYKYTGYDDQEFDDTTGTGRAKGVLSKYDEELGVGSSRDEGFRLGSAVVPMASTSNGSAGPGGMTDKERQLNRELLSLDYSKLEQNDYLKEGDVGFKKPKKKKKSSKSSRRAAADEDDTGLLDTNGDQNGDTAMGGAEEDHLTPSIPSAARRLAKEGGGADDGAVIDDEDLQAALARQRRAAGKKRIQAMRAEDVARQVEEERNGGTRAASTSGAAADADNDMLDLPTVKTEEQERDDGVDEGEEDDGLVLNDTSEFIRNISARPLISKREQAARPRAKPRVKTEETDGDVPLDEIDMNVKVEEEDEPEEGEAFDEMDEDMGIVGTEQDTEGKPDIKQEGKEEEGAAFGSTADEKLISGGMASTLALLRQSGLVKAMTPEEIERDRAYKERERFLAEARLRDAEKELERARLKGAGVAKDQTEREYENKRLQFEHAQRTLDAFRDYKPNVDISYQDEFGRTLTAKEAWKELSHKFHGKGSGTNKRDKLLKRIEEERKREAMASSDSPLNTSAAFQARQERMGSATMVIGVGNRNAAPSAEALLGPANGKGVALNKRGGPSGSASGSNKRKKDAPKILG